MSFQDEVGTPSAEGAAFPWILEHLLAYPGTYEIPLRTMYTLNSNSQSQPSSPAQATFPQIAGNAFPRPQSVVDEQKNASTATAAAQLRANLMTHLAQLPSQPSSLPPSFVTGFVRRCFPPELDQVDFPQALTALDYLKDLEVRRRREVVAALDRLGVERDDIGQKETLGKKYPGVLQWVLSTEEKERKVEALYTQVYVGLRRWTLINECSLVPFSKHSCLAMLNTLYPPTGITSTQFVQPTAQLTPKILSAQRNGFFRYIAAVEKNGPGVLSSLMDQHKKPGDATGWVNLRETLDKYLRMAVAVIDDCYDIGGRAGSAVTSPTATSFSSAEVDEDSKRRNVHSGISFTTATTTSSNRNSAQSQQSRPSTTSSISTHSRQPSKEKVLPEKPLPAPVALPELSPVEVPSSKPAGSTLGRIAREIRKIKSRGDVKDGSRRRPSTAQQASNNAVTTGDQSPARVKERRLRPMLSLKKMRSSSALRDSTVVSASPVEGQDAESSNDLGVVPAFDVEDMKRRRKIWEAQQKNSVQSQQNSAEEPTLVGT